MADAVIKITGDATGLEAATTKATSLFGGLSAQAQKLAAGFGLAGDSVGAVGAALVAGGLVAGAAAFAVFVKTVTAGVDALNDVKAATGSSIENISALEDVANRTGIGLDTVGTSLVKFNKALIAAKDPSSDASILLKQIGLDAAALQRIDPAEAFRQTAVALSKFADDGGKARLVQELFGKSLQEVAPLLKDLAEQGELHAKVTTRQAQEAKKFNDELNSLSKNAKDFARSLVLDLLPSLNNLFDRVKELGVLGATKEQLGIGVAIAKVRAEIFSLTKDLAGLHIAVKQSDASGNAFARLAGVEAAAKIPGVIKQLEKLRAEEARLKQSRTGQGIEPGGTRNTETRGFNPGEKEIDSAAIEAAKKAAAEQKKRQEEVIAAEKRRLASVLALNRAIDEKNALEIEEGQSIGKSTEAEKFKAKILSDIEKGYIELTAAERENLDIGLNNLLVREKIRLADQALVAQLKSDREETAKTIEAAQQRLAQDEQTAIAEQQKVDEYGLSREALQRLTEQRDADTISALRSRAATLDTLGAMGDLRQLYLDQADALEKASAARTGFAAKEKFARTDAASGAKRAVSAYVEELNDVGTAMERIVGGGLKGLEDGLTELFAKGKFDAHSFIDAMISEFVRLQVVKPLLANIFGGGSGGELGSVFSAIGGLFASDFATNQTGTSLPTSGGRAGGGPVMAGQTYRVGERGPEWLTMGGASGAITPNGGIGGSATINQTINVGAGVNASQLAQAMQQAKDQAKSEISEQMRRGSRAYG